jgi:MoaA/NifB/PqqE/SkfB family radical SAM enzyme
MKKLSEYAILIVQGMPCTNQCMHCSVFGSPHKQSLNFRQISIILEEWAKLHDYIDSLGVYFMDEPTNHPDFLEIYEEMAYLGFIRDEIVTNGSRLAEAEESVWQRLIDLGLKNIQLSLYGVEETHDRFAGRSGAFKQAIQTAHRAKQFGVNRSWACYFGLWNIHQVNQIVKVVRDIEEQPGLDLTRAVMMFTSAGRGRYLERYRPKKEDLEQLPEPYRSNLYPRRLRSEREWVELLLSEDEQSEKKAIEFNPNSLALQIEPDFNVYAPGNVSSENVRDGFRLGNLNEENFLTMIQRLLEKRPPEAAALEKVTWGELAYRYGDASNEKLYYLPFDLVPNKWGREYLTGGVSFE